MDWNWRDLFVSWEGLEFMDSGPIQHRTSRPKTKFNTVESTATVKVVVWATELGATPNHFSQ